MRRGSCCVVLAILLAGPALHAQEDIRLELVRHSLTATHYRYRQYFRGVSVVGGEVNVSVAPDGSVRDSVRTIARVPDSTARFAFSSVAGGDAVPFNDHGLLRIVIRTETSDGIQRTIRYSDPGSGALLREEPQYAMDKAGRVFDPNPVARLNDPTLQDRNDAASAVPDAAYSLAGLLDVKATGPLGGPWVQIEDLQAPFIAPVDGAGPLVFDRSQSGFEDVNAYYHIDSSQRYLRSLGYSGDRAIAPYPIAVDTHAAGGNDSSYFVSASVAGRSSIYFGTGGTDDAEDSDLVIHEYAHVIHDWIAPGTYLGPHASEGRALSEGLGDYWAFSATYAKTVASGRDPYCFADWDARCWEDANSESCAYAPGSDCLRRLDAPKTLADFITTESPGTEHLNGEIWSAALAEIFVSLTQRYGFEAGKRISDTLVIESLFAPPPNPSFSGIARKMIEADHYLYGGANGDLICAAMMRRGIAAACAAVPRGELTWNQGAEHGVSIPDNDLSGITLRMIVSDPRPVERLYVNVNIAHTSRGDLRLVLVAPDGTERVLQEATIDRTAGIHATYGLDAMPAQSLDIFKGRSIAGEWQLRVSDVRPLDAGTVLSWSLIAQFGGDVPLDRRPSAEGRQVIPVAAHTPGANGAFFTTDLRLFNRGSSERTATLIFTASGHDGRTDFAAANVVVPGGEVVALDDVVQTMLRTTGSGQLEIDGNVVVASRTSTADGSAGDYVAAMRVDDAAGQGETLIVPFVAESDLFRTNIGLAEVRGAQAVVRVRVLTANHEVVSTADYPLAPFGHLQFREDRPLANGYVTLMLLEGSGLIGYGALIANQSGDPTVFPAVKPLGSDTMVAAPVIGAPGAAGSDWRTDVALVPRDGTAATIPMSLTTSEGAESRILTIGAAELLPDVVRLTFLRETTASLAIFAPGGTVIGGRTVDSSRQHGGYVPFTPASKSRSLDIIFVERSERSRTNIGIFADAVTAAHIVVYDSAGGELETRDLSLEPMRLVQFPIGSDVVDGRVHIETAGGGVWAYASVVDNRTGDAIHVPAQ